VGEVLFEGLDLLRRSHRWKGLRERREIEVPQFQTSRMSTISHESAHPLVERMAVFTFWAMSQEDEWSTWTQDKVESTHYEQVILGRR